MHNHRRQVGQPKARDSTIVNSYFSINRQRNLSMATNLTIGKIPYSLGLRISNPSEKDSAKKIFAYAQSQTINTRQLANHWASHTSSFSRGECLGIIEDLCSEIQEMLLEGHAVLLDGIGKLYLTISSEGVDDVEDWTQSNISRVNVRFTADKNLQNSINNNAQFELVSSREAQAAAIKAEKEALTDELGGGSGSGSGNSGSGSGDPGDVTP